VKTRIGIIGRFLISWDFQGVQQRIIWGNVDAGLLQAWKAITWAVAELSGGFVQTASGEQSALDIRKTAALLPPFPTG
jgi:hypothetical protein